MVEFLSMPEGVKTTWPLADVSGAEQFSELVGADLPPSEWLAIGREQLELLERATFHGPSTNYPDPGAATATHGTHTLALLPPMFEQAVILRGFRAVVLVGFDRVRFPAPVALGARFRVRFRLDSVAPARSGYEAHVHAAVELEDEDRPACVCDMVLRLLE